MYYALCTIQYDVNVLRESGLNFITFVLKMMKKKKSNKSLPR